jgi:hypothetical protein
MDVRPEIRVTVAGSEKTGSRIPVDPGARVLLTATPTELDASDLVWLLDGRRVPDSLLGQGRRTLAVSSFGGSHAGTYTVRAGGVASRAVMLVPRGANGRLSGPGGAGDGQTTAVELAPGVYDPRFAKRATVIALVTGGIVSAASLVLLWVGAFRYDGSFAERAGLIMPVLSGWIGSLAVIGGIWMGAVETRGRLWLRIAGMRTSPRTQGDVPGGARAERQDAFAGADEIARQLPEFVRSLSVVRGTVVVLVIGALVLCTSVMASCNVLADTQPSGGATTPAKTTTTTTAKR